LKVVKVFIPRFPFAIFAPLREENSGSVSMKKRIFSGIDSAAKPPGFETEKN
jgi:hypothetical protein